MYPNEDACRDFLIEVRWVDGFICPHCSDKKYWKQVRGTLCCKNCRKDISVTAGTIFHGRHLSLRLWFQALWLVVSQKSGVSALGLSRALGIQRQMTGWHLLDIIRTVMVRGGRERLSGLVEDDEVFIGGVRAGKRGRGALGKVLVLVAVEDKGDSGIGRIQMTIIPDATSTTLKQAIESMVEACSKIRTDDFKSYPAITKHGYTHVVMKRQSLEPGEDPTPLVHRVASLTKRWLLGTHQGGCPVRESIGVP